MEIIDKSKKSPYFKYKPRPAFKTLLEEQRYFAKEKQKWIEGEGEIPGSLYFFLQEGFLKHRVVPQGHDSVERPLPRAASLWMHQRFKETWSKGKVQGVIKARGVGLSTEGGALCNYYAKVFPGSNSIVTSKDMDGISVLFREKIYIPYQHLDKKIRPDELSKNNTKQRCHLSLGVTHLGIDGNEKYSTSTIELRETSERPESPQNFSGQGAAFGFWDEFALHPKKEQLLNSAIECFRNPFTKELDGHLLFGGTLEESMTSKDINGFRLIIEKKDLWNCDVLFVPFWWSMFLDTAGFPDEKRAYEWWEKEAEKIADNPSKLKAFMRNNPRNLEDIFESDKGRRWEDDVSELLVRQKNAVIKADTPVGKYNIIITGDSAKAEPLKSGVYEILEPVKPSCEYILLVDGVASDKSTGSNEGSNMAGVIVKMFDPTTSPFMPVCIYNERPQTIEGGYRRLMGQILYYNTFQGFKKVYAEANAATASHFGNYLLTNRLAHFIARRKDISGKGWVDKTKWFQYRTPELLDFLYKQANIFLRRHSGSIQMLTLLDDMLKGIDENADVLDAWLQLFVARPDFDSVEKPKALAAKKTVMTLQFINGVTRWVEVPV